MCCAVPCGTSGTAHSTAFNSPLSKKSPPEGYCSTDIVLFFLFFCGRQICSLLRGGIAERGGVRVGHRIIEINGQSVVAVPHERIVGLLATSVGEVMNLRKLTASLFAVAD